MKRARLLSAAQEDLGEAITHYARVSPAAANRFVSRFETAIERIENHPGIGGRTKRGSRRFSTSDFPYSVIYREEATELMVFAIAHDSRQPAFWQARVSESRPPYQAREAPACSASCRPWISGNRETGDGSVRHAAGRGDRPATSALART